MVLADYIQNTRFLPYFLMKFIYDELEKEPVNLKNSTTKYQLQLEFNEKNQWQEFANDKFRGNLARMIRILVNHSILNGYNENSSIPEELVNSISSIQVNSEQTGEKVTSFGSDLIIIKNLLSKLLQKESEYVQNYQSTISLPLEDLVYQRVYEYVKSQKRIVVVEELLPYLLRTSIESKRFIASEDLKLPSGGKIAIAFILEEVMMELTEKGEIDIIKAQGANKYDF